MKTATISEAKNNLSALVDRVRAGETILIVDRSTRVARPHPRCGIGTRSRGRRRPSPPTRARRSGPARIRPSSRGLLPAPATSAGGIPADNEGQFFWLLDRIGRREGIGDVLADGSQRAARTLGKGESMLITVKGAEAPAHMPQAKRSLALVYAVNPFGADHQSSEHDPMIEEGASDLYMGRLKLMGFDHALVPRSLDAEKVRFALKGQQFYSFFDTAALCQFVWGPAWTLYGPQETVDFVRAATGWDDFTLDELLEIGERRLNMLRAFNARLGIGKQADRCRRSSTAR